MDGETEHGGELTLIINTSDGAIVRRIQPALPRAADPGAAAEDAVRCAAAVFGLPDFVFRPAVHSDGTKIREIGDAIVTVGEVAAVVQVKSRAKPSADVDRELRWLGKQIQQASGQARGTIRNLRDKTVTLVNERGRAIPIVARTKTWVPVVIIDHTQPPSGEKFDGR